MQWKTKSVIQILLFSLIINVLSLFGVEQPAIAINLDLFTLFATTVKERIPRANVPVNNNAAVLVFDFIVDFYV